jgi:hypothetical protein
MHVDAKNNQLKIYAWKIIMQGENKTYTRCISPDGNSSMLSNQIPSIIQSHNSL